MDQNEGEVNKKGEKKTNKANIQPSWSNKLGQYKNHYMAKRWLFLAGSIWEIQSG